MSAAADHPALPTAPSIPCLRCGYDLIHLPDAALCPECAYSVRESRTGSLLATADPTHIRRLRLGALLLACAAVLAVLNHSLYELQSAWDRSMASASARTIRWTHDIGQQGPGAKFYLHYPDNHILRLEFRGGLSFAVTHTYPDHSSTTTIIDDKDAVSWKTSAVDPDADARDAQPVAAPPPRPEISVFARIRIAWEKYTRPAWINPYADMQPLGPVILGMNANPDHSLVVIPMMYEKARPVEINNSGNSRVLPMIPIQQGMDRIVHTGLKEWFQWLEWTRLGLGLAYVSPLLAGMLLLTRRDRAIEPAPLRNLRRWSRTCTIIAIIPFTASITTRILEYIAPSIGARLRPTWLFAALSLTASVATLFRWLYQRSLSARLQDRRGAACAVAIAAIVPATYLLELALVSMPQSFATSLTRGALPLVYHIEDLLLLSTNGLAFWLLLRFRRRLKLHAARVHAATAAAPT